MNHFEYSKSARICIVGLQAFKCISVPKLNNNLSYQEMWYRTCNYLEIFNLASVLAKRAKFLALYKRSKFCNQ